MHQSIQDYLEEFLRDPGDRNIPAEFHIHRTECASCAAELKALELQTRLLRTMRAPAELELAAGFYASVMARVEEQTTDSFWSVFLQPAFARSLALASVVLVLLMGTYIYSTEPGPYLASPQGVVMSERSADFEDGSIKPTQRDAVLVSLATFRE
jgi:hypothetical protein